MPTPNLQIVIDQIIGQLDFVNDEVETLVETAFIAGGKAMVALLTIDDINGTGENSQQLTDYVTGIAGLTHSVGGFLNSLTDAQKQAYRDNLKKVITNSIPEVEAALEAFADSNLDLTASVIAVNTAINNLQTPQQ